MNKNMNKHPLQDIIPFENLETKHMYDSQQFGTLVTKLEDGFVFTNLDDYSASKMSHAVLVQLDTNTYDPETIWEDKLCNLPVCACDLDGQSSYGALALVGLDEGDELPSDLGKVLWDSRNLEK